MKCENCGREVRDELEHWSRGYEVWFCSPVQYNPSDEMPKPSANEEIASDEEIE